MTYKKHIFFLSLFAMPYTMVGKNTVKIQMQIDGQIEELKEKIYQKELEIFNLGNMIEEKDKHYSMLKLEIRKNIEAMIDVRLEQLKKQNNGKSLSQEDKDRIDAEVRKKLKEFVKNFFDAVNDGKKIKGILEANPFQQDKADYGFFNFYLIRSIFDYQFILGLINQYENCIQELSKLKNELTELQKQ